MVKLQCFMKRATKKSEKASGFLTMTTERNNRAQSAHCPERSESKPVAEKLIECLHCNWSVLRFRFTVVQ